MSESRKTYKKLQTELIVDRQDDEKVELFGDVKSTKDSSEKPKSPGLLNRLFHKSKPSSKIKPASDSMPRPTNFIN